MLFYHGPQCNLRMAMYNLDRGPGMLKLASEWYWAGHIMFHNIAGFAGWYRAGMGLNRDGPNRVCG